MDSVLLDYLRSGNAWLLVGSGPSIEMGYPTWRDLAIAAVELCEAEGDDADPARTLLSAGDYPTCFQRVADDVGIARLTDHLRGRLTATSRGFTYEALAQWPINVFLTTNYDDEIANHLARLSLAYQTYANTEDHMGLLNPALTNAIFKLHGDLRSPNGLVLTGSQYRALETSPEWDHWRTRLTSVFQMHPIVIVGHSLNDPHIRLVLAAAKSGATVTQPVCWLAPGVTTAEAREYLTKFKIRVIGYPVGDGDHRGLRTLISDISRFVPPREAVRISRQVAAVVEQGRPVEPAAAAVFVFNRLAPHVDPVDLRVAVASAAIEAQFASVPDGTPLSLETALTKAGWPESPAPGRDFLERVADSLVSSNVATPSGEQFIAGSRIGEARSHREDFEHLRRTFHQSLVLRIKRDCPDIGEDELDDLARDIEAALTGYFRAGGLTLATLLFAARQAGPPPVVPASVVAFLNQASARYTTLSKRRAFSHASLNLFIDSTAAEREYLGRLAQGFFAFHALGAFGESAIERLARARETVWLIDSNTLIPLLALAAPSNAAFVGAFQQLKDSGVRAYTTERLLDEAAEHFNYASLVVQRLGSDSPFIVAAATGQAPYRRQNQFLQGFIRWRDAGHGDDWLSYVWAMFNTRSPDRSNIDVRLRSLGVETVAFPAWPGFKREDYVEVEEAKQTLKGLMIQNLGPAPVDRDLDAWLEDKLPPEGEAVVIIRHERGGSYHIMSDEDYQSPGFFISSTAMINAVAANEARITWQPEAFLAFVGSLMTRSGGASSDRAFEVVVWTIAASGANPISEQTIERVFGAVIDQTSIIAGEEKQVYDEMLAEKYGESSERVLARIPASRRAIAALQLNNEIVKAQEQRVVAALAKERETASHAKVVEKELSAVTKYKTRMLRRQAQVTANKKKKAGRARTKKRR